MANVNLSTINRFPTLVVGTSSISAAGISSGEIRAGGDITAFATSDKRYKDNVQNIIDPLGKINSLNGVTFDWSDEYIKEHGGEDGVFVRKHDVGLIAQEVQAVIPEIVATRENGTLAIKYDRLVALLIEGIKELQKEIKILKGE